ncbi:MAG: Ig-like domain-containing protein [Myxococcaceae bacterium]|nr:Ig-like domain-containing protein [Myxococcaceae bacterium]
MRLVVSALVAVAVALSPALAHAQCGRPGVSGYANFTFPDGSTSGDTILYSNVGLLGGQAVDVRVTRLSTTPSTGFTHTLQGINGAAVVTFASAMPPGAPGTATLRLRYEIVRTGTNTPASGDFSAEIGDLDRTANFTERIIPTLGGLTAYELARTPPTTVQAGARATELVFSGTADNNTGAGAVDNAVVLTFRNRSTFDIAYEVEHDGTTFNRFFALDASLPNFITPATSTVCVPVVDTDNDTVPNLIDVDDDGDGLDDALEGSGDVDQDGIPNALDLDSDGDGITDVLEAGGVDANVDGRLDGCLPAQGNGRCAGGGLATPRQTDTDGRPDFLDADSDDDGVPDAREYGYTDANGDGRVDSALDANNDGLLDSPRTSGTNTDGDLLPDHRDTDSDADGVTDFVEAFDTNNDGTADRAKANADADGDGIDNAFDVNCTVATCGATGLGVTSPLSVARDRDGDGLPNWQDGCADGYLRGGEACDDGNGQNGDGCSSTCTLEPGFSCTGVTPTRCIQVTAPVILTPAQNATVGPNPSISGTGVAGALVTVTRMGGASVYTATVSASGAWSCMTVLGNGTYVVTASQTLMNVTGPSSAARTFTVSGTLPTVVIAMPPAINAMNAGSYVVSGTCTAAAGNVSLTVGTLMSMVPCSSGTFTTTVDTRGLPDAPQVTLSASQTNASGTVIDTKYALKDTQAPAAPQVTAPANQARLTDTRPAITGTGEPNATVTVTLNGAVAGTALVDGAGQWTFTPTMPLTPGPNTVSATQTDVAGNTSPSSPTNTFTIEAANPPPVITAPQDGAMLSTRSPPISGTATAGTTVTVRLNGTALGTTTATPQGTFSVTPPMPLAPGTYSAVATATNGSGSVSANSNTVVFTISAGMLDAPTVTAPANGAVTRDTTPDVEGTATPGASVTVILDGQDVGTVTADMNGRWSFTPTMPLTEGPHDVRARQSVNGSTSGDSASNRFVVDTRGPPTTLAVTPADSSEGTTVTASGVTEPNARVTVFVGMAPVGMVTADANGLWQLPLPAAAIPPGEYEVSAEATDPAGNTGPRSQVVRVIIRRSDSQWGGGGFGGLGGCTSVPGSALFALALVLRRRRAR